MAIQTPTQVPGSASPPWPTRPARGQHATSAFKHIALAVITSVVAMAVAASSGMASQLAGGGLANTGGRASAGSLVAGGTRAASTTGWSQVSPMLITRYALAAATGADGTIYALGGDHTTGTPLSSMEAYSPATNTWTEVAPMPTARLYLAAATGGDGRIYAMGGIGSDTTGVVEAYDPPTDTWSTVAPMPTPRYGLAATTGTDGLIYAIGGNEGIYNSTKLEAYSPATNTWAELAPMPTAREYLAAATGADGTIYAIGGIGNDIFTTVEAYTPTTNTWATLAPMPTARYLLAAGAGADGLIYAIGGLNYSGNTPNNLATVEAYSPDTNSWTEAAPLATPTSYLAATTGTDGTVYALGGSTDTGIVGARQLAAASSSQPTAAVEAYRTVEVTTPTTSSTPTSSSVALSFANSDRATVTGTANAGNPTGTVGFFVCGPSVTSCASGGTAVGSPVGVTAAQGTTATATSVAFTPTSAGTYCFRSEYSGDSDYTASSDGSSGECFTVVDANDLTAAGKSFKGPERKSLTAAVAAFNDPGSTEPIGSFGATLTWGDGSPASAGVVTGSAGSYVVSGTHTYADEGQFSVSVVITESDGDTPAPHATATGTATIAEADQLTASARTFNARHGTAFSGTVATVTDSVSNVAADFTVSINWGDGTALSVGTVTGSGKSFSMSGRHTYARAGKFTVTVTISDGSPGTGRSVARSAARIS
jgi:N-acetylneuraminic acid mutarotase